MNMTSPTISYCHGVPGGLSFACAQVWSLDAICKSAGIKLTLQLTPAQDLRHDDAKPETDSRQRKIREAKSVLNMII